jgi:hypothetical protein
MDYARSFPDFDYPLAWLEQPIILRPHKLRRRLKIKH